MALANPQIESFTKYLKNNFPFKENWEAAELLGESFTYEEVREALKRLKTTDPLLHKNLGYRWQSTRSRNSIANSLYCDPSTLKRRWDKAIKIIINYLVNKEVTAELEPIDLIVDI